MSRLILALMSLALAAPLHADPLPQGEFLLGTYIWPDAALPRYATLRVDGAALTIELSSALPLNPTECDTTGNCIFGDDLVTAQADVVDGVVRLTSVDVDADAVIDDGPDYPTHALYAVPLLAGIEAASVSDAPNGFTLTSGLGTIYFYRADAEARAAVQAYPMGLSLSIRQLAGCDVRNLAPLFSRPDLTEGEVMFRDVLRGMAVATQIDAERRRAAPPLGDRDTVDQNLVRSLQFAGMIPTFMSFEPTPEGQDPVEVFWSDTGQSMFEGDRAGFDAAVARYGDTLLPLVGFFRHMRGEGVNTDAATQCTDLSLGFISSR